MNQTSNTQTTKARIQPRRFLQFSLRTVLVAMTVLALWLGMWLDRGRREKAAVEALSQKGYVGIMYDYQVDPSGKWVTNPSPPGSDWARDWIGEHCFTRVVRLSRFRSDLDDDALAHVAQFRQIRSLRNDVMMVSAAEVHSLWISSANYIDSGYVTDTGIAHLKRLARLEALVLVGTTVTNDGLRELTGLQRLKRLKISSPNITDEGIPHFLRLRNLEALCVSGTSISEAGVSELRRGLPNCQIVGPADVPDPEEEEQQLGIYSP